MNETNVSSSIKEPIGGMHVGDENSISNIKFISRLGRDCDIGRVYWTF